MFTLPISRSLQYFMHLPFPHYQIFGVVCASSFHIMRSLVSWCLPFLHYEITNIVQYLLFLHYKIVSIVFPGCLIPLTSLSITFLLSTRASPIFVLLCITYDFTLFHWCKEMNIKAYEKLYDSFSIGLLFHKKRLSPAIYIALAISEGVSLIDTTLIHFCLNFLL